MSKALGQLNDSCGGTPLSSFALSALARGGPRWLQAQKATLKN